MYVRASFTSLYEASIKEETLRVNRRAAPREKTRELAELIIDLKGRKVACLVHNISDGGAMIECSFRTLPKRVILNYPDQEIRSVCRVAWLYGNMAGLEFL